MNKIEKMFLDLNSVLVKFWIEQGRPDKETKIALLERMLNWYKKMGYVTPQTLSEEPDKSLEEAAGDFVWEVMEEDYDGPSELSKKLRPSSKISDYYNALAEFFKAGAKWGIEHAKK